LYWLARLFVIKIRAETIQLKSNRQENTEKLLQRGGKRLLLAERQASKTKKEYIADK